MQEVLWTAVSPNAADIVYTLAEQHIRRKLQRLCDPATIHIKWEYSSVDTDDGFLPVRVCIGTGTRISPETP